MCAGDSLQAARVGYADELYTEQRNEECTTEKGEVVQRIQEKGISALDDQRRIIIGVLSTTE